jgi:hypothetical protein
VAQETIKQHRRYLSYLLRLWQANSGDPPLWWASLENPRDGDCLGFASLEALFSFLVNETRSSSPDLEHLDEKGYQPSSKPE